MAFISGNRTSFSDTDGHILDLADGLKYLKPRNDALELLRRIGMHGFTAKSTKVEWNEVSIAGRTETVTLADGSGTALTVADAYVYQVNDLIRIEDEIVKVGAIASSTGLTIVRGVAGTSGAAHAAKVAVHMGSADPENSDAPAGMSDDQTRLYNYVQTFTRAVDLSNDEIAVANVEGNPLSGNIARRYVEWMRFFATTLFYGSRSQDSTNKVNYMGGLKFYVTTNPTSAGGALTTALIDTEIKQIRDAGGDPDTIVVGTKQKQKLDAIDANLIRLGLRQGPDATVAGNRAIQTWQSGVLSHTLDVLVDDSIRDDELWILDSSMIKIGPLVNNGIDGNVHVADATTPGKDGTKKVIRGKYTMKVMLEKSHSLLYALT